MTNPTTPDYDKFKVGDNTRTGVTLHLYNHLRIILVQDMTDLEEFRQILKSQNWIDVCLKLETPSATLTFGILTHENILAFAVDGYLWNLRDKAVYNHIVEQVDLLIERLILHKANQDRSEELSNRSKITKESLSLISSAREVTIVYHYASGGIHHFYVGLVGFGALFRALVDLESDSRTYMVRKEGIDGFTIRNDKKWNCVCVNIDYQNGTKRCLTLSYYNIRQLADELPQWLLPEVFEGYHDEFDLNRVQNTLRTKYERDSDVKHEEEVVAPVVSPASPVGITEVCKFLMDHPEHHTTMLAILHDIGEARKRVSAKP